jgi:molybdenum cofactor biosynthesis protein MoaC
MVDITHKEATLRTAVAEAIVTVGRPETITAVREKTVPKGDVLETARVAGLYAAKRTHDMIPDCHPLPVEFTAVRFEIGSQEIRLEVEVKTVYKTGVEVEAMHAASVVALTIYDMLKPIDKQVEIHRIRLLRKTGGKSDFKAKSKER